MWSDCVNFSIKLTYKKGWSIPLTLLLFSLYTDMQCHVWQKQVSVIIWISIIVRITVAVQFLDTHRFYVTVGMKFCVDAVSVRLNMELLAVVGWQQACCSPCTTMSVRRRFQLHRNALKNGWHAGVRMVVQYMQVSGRWYSTQSTNSQHKTHLLNRSEIPLMRYICIGIAYA